MTDKAKEAKTSSEKFINAVVSLTLLWFGVFIGGAAMIVLIRSLMWVWQHMEL